MAENTGINFAMLAILLVVLLIGMILIPMFGGISVITKFLFPIILIIGIVFIVLYTTKIKYQMTSVGFSTLISTDVNCNGISEQTSTDYASANAVSDACEQDIKCNAFDWQGLIINPNDGTTSDVSPPKTTLYSAVSHSPCAGVMNTPDKTKILRVPGFSSGPNDPDPKAVVLDGNMYLNTTTSQYYQKNDDQAVWELKGVFVKNFSSSNTISWGSIAPKSGITSGTTGDVYVYYDSSDPVYFVVYTLTDSTNKTWTSNQISGPNMIPTIPKNVNYSGFKIGTKTQWYLYVGIGLMVLGVFGTIFAFIGGGIGVKGVSGVKGVKNKGTP